MSGIWISRGKKISEEGLVGDPLVNVVSDLEKVPNAIQYLRLFYEEGNGARAAFRFPFSRNR